jgi:hypothetical protein
MDEGRAPIAVDLCCGLGGWTAGLLAEGYRVVGFDIVRPRSFPAGALKGDCYWLSIGDRHE